MEKNEELINACKNGDQKIVEKLLRSKMLFFGVDVNFKDNQDTTPLHYAVLSGNYNIVEMLINEGANINIRGSDGTPLNWAIKYGRYIIADILIQKGADIFEKDSNGYTLLHWASWRGDSKAVNYLLSKGIDINVKDNKGDTPLLVALLGHNTHYYYNHGGTGVYIREIEQLTELLVSRGAEMDIRVLHRLFDGISVSYNYGGDYEAVGKEFLGLRIFEMLLQQVTGIDEFGCSRLLKKALYYAKPSDRVKINSLETFTNYVQQSYNADMFYKIAFILILKGAEVKETDDLDFLIYYSMYFLIKGDREKIDILISKSSNSLFLSRFIFLVKSEFPQLNDIIKKSYLNKSYSLLVEICLRYDVYPDEKTILNETPIFWALEDGNNETVKMLIEKGANLNYVNDFGKTPIFTAIINGNKENVQLLIEKGAEINYLDSQNFETPLLLAQHLKDNEIIDLLAKNGADINFSKKFADVKTSFFLAVRENKFEFVRILIDNGVDVNEKNEAGETPLFYAALDGNVEIVKMLVEKGADVNATSIYGITPLFWTSKEEIAEILLKKGADVNAISKYGYTPLFSSVICKRAKMVKLLIDYGADVNAISTGFGGGSTFCHIVKKGVIDSAYRESILHYASKTGEFEIVKILIKNGANVNWERYGSTPRSIAIQNNHNDVAKLLIENGAKCQ